MQVDKHLNGSQVYYFPVTPFHAIKVYGGSEVVAPIFFKLRIKWGQLSALRPRTQARRSPVLVPFHVATVRNHDSFNGSGFKNPMETALECTWLLVRCASISTFVQGCQSEIGLCRLQQRRTEESFEWYSNRQPDCIDYSTTDGRSAHYSSSAWHKSRLISTQVCLFLRWTPVSCATTPSVMSSPRCTLAQHPDGCDGSITPPALPLDDRVTLEQPCC